MRSEERGRLAVWLCLCLAGEGKGEGKEEGKEEEGGTYDDRAVPLCRLCMLVELCALEGGGASLSVSATPRPSCIPLIRLFVHSFARG